ncbi:GGDEF domain-containing protein [Vibrio tapetis subsp. quintayensis]|uniref:GGDEF domain-containing protein n=1 Tax=Vibrio tapetis TaxID=52443 RepID=UPI0025B3451A|nr:GGDEF domain-containing protein [Vibrio tapetis]MDN3683048.1 GGDEF domain-containing protein [Vibrio tapetis subsp. quintayensis]
MINSLFKKLVLLFFTSFLLTFLIMVSSYNTFSEQTKTDQELEQLIHLQLSVDLLRSQLWLLLQSDGDFRNFEHVAEAQLQLTDEISEYQFRGVKLENIKRMNGSLSSLLTQEKRLLKLSHLNQQDMNQSGITLIHSRYNMLVQSMTEELAYMHQEIVYQSSNNITQSMLYGAIGLVISSLFVSAIAWLIMYRFRLGISALTRAIYQLSSGKLDCKVDHAMLDVEFTNLSMFFNKMTSSLKESVVTRQELEREVKKQTQALKDQQAQLLFFSEYDPLTNALNRRAFDAALSNAIIKANRTHLKIAVLFIDLDKFKQVNDNYGHEAGDTTLMAVSERLQAIVRRSDFVGRYGGDEFIVCFDLLDNYEIIPQKVNQIIDAIEKPVPHQGDQLQVGCSIGVSYYGVDSIEKDELTRIADTRMYQAKLIDNSAAYDSDYIKRPWEKVNEQSNSA